MQQSYASTNAASGAEVRSTRKSCDRACYKTLQWPVDLRHDGEQPSASAPRHGTALPQLPQPAHRLLAECGEEGLRHLVQLHMQRLRHTALLSRSDKCFECVAQRVADFVVESCGGALFYSAHHASMQAGAGLPLLLDADAREVWLVQLWHAFDEAGLSASLRAAFWSWAEPLSVYLLAPKARHQNLTRYPYDTVRSWFPETVRRH